MVAKIDFQLPNRTEYAVINEVSKHGLCKPVLSKYVNGICYAYTPGTSPNGALMLTEEFLEEAALKFARLVTSNDSFVKRTIVAFLDRL